MKFDHLFWTYRRFKKSCWLEDEIDGFKDEPFLSIGRSFKDNYPDDVSIAMDADFPKDTVVLDHLRNDLQICSGGLTDFLKSKEIDNVEYLPIWLINHKGRKVKPCFNILNPVTPIDCLDLAACNVRYFDEEEGVIDTVEKFVIDETKCQDFPALMRIEGIRGKVLIHRELAMAIDAEGFTGCGWLELADMVGKDLFYSLPIVKK